MTEPVPKMRKVKRPPMWVCLMARFIRIDEVEGPKAVCTMLPLESYYNAAIKKARSNGWIRRTQIGFSFGPKDRVTDRGNFLWKLTERGERVALDSARALDAYRQEVSEAGAEWRRQFAEWKEQR